MISVVTRWGRFFTCGAAIFAMTLALSIPAKADPLKCQMKLVKGLLKFNKAYLKYQSRCIEQENLGKIPGPCPDALTQLKIQTYNEKVVTAISNVCAMSDIATLNFRSDCAYEAATTGIEAQCAALPVTTVSEFVECLKCWKAAELSEYVALLYASHALEQCNGNLDETSSRCSDLDCTTPVPDQRNLGDTGENDCQRGIGRRGIKYMLSRQKILEKCVLAGGTQTSCLADLLVQVKLAKAEQVKQVGIQKKCGQRAPSPSVPFCCRTGTGQQCTVEATRADCITAGGTVQEGKTCTAGSCSGGGPNQQITWWSNCPESDTCPGPTLTSRADLVACVDSSADRIVDELLCLQFPNTWTCTTDVP